ncbi:tail fiber assembly protein [Dickeya fangzhongdai]|uniref:tail fiber assembly protein n=1 Tax=Dickeya fangzhongdai TaxID=1778540 RepID=UPI001368BAA3|nr:tail fiber assembly protein [Dickeya fangzhongdai]UMB76656.1 tail fiber assembly protein [Dickeya fangzhongdai]
MTISTQEARAVLAADGLASHAGWLRVYHADTLTREYYGYSDEYLMPGTGIPAHSYADEPLQSVTQGQALCRSADGQCWESVSDFRGHTAYHTQTRQPQTIKVLGELSAGLTLLPPTSECDRWDGEKWATDAIVYQASLLQAARLERDARRQMAHDRIRELTYAQELEIATEQETRALKDWKIYLVQLSRIDPNQALTINLPPIPTN